MQDKNKKHAEKEHRDILLKAVGNVVFSLRDKTASASTFYIERGLQPVTFLPIERGQTDLRISTFYKLANVFGIPFSEFAKLVEKELPEGFVLFEEE